jgi:MYXO-CTERM domain-containing protein
MCEAPKRRRAALGSTSVRGLGLATALWAGTATAATLTNDVFNVEIGKNGEVSSLALVGDAFPTNYVLNATNAPGQDTADHEWVGELMFSYRLGSGAFQTALTQASSDVRQVQSSTTSVSVTYENSTNQNGIKNFKVVETYSLVGQTLSWQIALTNTSSQTLELGDVGLPLPFNEYWDQDNDVIYETRTIYHSFTGQNGSYVTVKRPSGVGPFLLLVPDPTTGAGFEYMDNWVSSEHPNSTWVANGGTPRWRNGLDVFYIHSNVIKSTNRGYLPNTSLTLAPGASKTYGFNFVKVASEDEVKSALHDQGLIDVTVVPSLVFARDMTAEFDLHTTQSIDSVTPQYPSESTLTSLGGSNDHHLYQLKLTHLGQNNVVVGFGGGLTTTLQFYVLEPVAAAIDRHSTFMVKNTVASSGSLAHVFDDWMLDTKAVRGATGGSGWGDDWGWTHGEFLAEKNAQTPVAAEVSALDAHLDAVWKNAIDNSSYVVQDWWCPAGTSASNPQNCFYNRPYAYPHAFNTFFSMYKIASLYPKLVTYHESADTYLLRAYGILHALYAGAVPEPTPPATIAGTGYMGEQTLPDIEHALSAGGHTTEAAFVKTTIDGLHTAFSGSPYPYGSEYKYDNTGEEAVYMAAKESSDADILSKVNAKTRACRGEEPVWYYYADPVTLNGENWWQFQYTAALAGYCMDDWERFHSSTPELDERLTYAAKLANLTAINSGQIDADPANLGSVAWTYQAMKGNVYVYSFEPQTSKLHNGWRQMAGEADLGLFGALRILSADVAVDPIFGVVGYGSDVSKAGDCYAVTPRDGVFKRLNLITEKLYFELSRDRYASASVSAKNDYVGLTLQNQTADAHTTTLTLQGLAPGSYSVSIGGTSAPSVTAAAGMPTSIALSVGTSAEYDVVIAGSATTCTGVGGAMGSGGASGAGGSAPGTGGSANGGASGVAAAAGGSVSSGAAGSANGATSVAGGNVGSGNGGATGVTSAGGAKSGGSVGASGTTGAGASKSAGASSGGSPSVRGASESRSGCGCRVAGSGERSMGSFALAGLAFSAAVRRRRHAASRVTH